MLWRKLGRLPRYAVTGSTAGPGIAPTRIAMIYVDDPEQAAEILELAPAEAGSNVWLLRPFDDVVYSGTRRRRGRGHEGRCRRDYRAAPSASLRRSCVVTGARPRGGGSRCFPSSRRSGVAIDRDTSLCPFASCCCLMRWTRWDRTGDPWCSSARRLSTFGLVPGRFRWLRSRPTGTSRSIPSESRMNRFSSRR
jgi:hypothetical protein